MKLTNKQIKDIEKLTNSRWAKNGRYFYWRTGRGIRYGSFRMYVSNQPHNKIKDNSPINWRQMPWYGNLYIIAKSGIINPYIKSFDWGLWPMPFEWLIPLGKILEENNETN